MDANIKTMTLEEIKKLLTELKGSINERLSNNKNLLGRQTIETSNLRKLLKEGYKNNKGFQKVPEKGNPCTNLISKRNDQKAGDSSLASSSKYCTHVLRQRGHKLISELKLSKELNEKILTSAREKGQPLSNHKNLCVKRNKNISVDAVLAGGEIYRLGYKKKLKKKACTCKKATCTMTEKKAPDLSNSFVYKKNMDNTLGKAQNATHKTHLSVQKHVKSQRTELPTEENEKHKNVLGKVDKEKQIQTDKKTQKVAKALSQKVILPHHYSKDIVYNIRTAQKSVLEKDIKATQGYLQHNFPKEDHPRYSNSSNVTFEDIEKLSALKLEKSLGKPHRENQEVTPEVAQYDFQIKALDIEDSAKLEISLLMSQEEILRNALNSVKVDYPELNAAVELSMLKLEKALAKPHKENQKDPQKEIPEVAQNDFQIKALNIENPSKLEISLHMSWEQILRNTVKCVQGSNQKDIAKDVYLQYNNKKNLNAAEEPWVSKFENSLFDASQNHIQSQYCKSPKKISKFEIELNKNMKATAELIIQQSSIQKAPQFRASYKGTQEIMNMLADIRKPWAPIFKKKKGKTCKEPNQKIYEKAKFPYCSNIILRGMPTFIETKDKPCKAPKKEISINTQKDQKSLNPKFDDGKQRMSKFEETKGKQGKDPHKVSLKKKLKDEKSKKFINTDIDVSRTPTIENEVIIEPQSSSRTEADLNKIMDQAYEIMTQVQDLNTKLSELRIIRVESLTTFDNNYWEKVRVRVEKQFK